MWCLSGKEFVTGRATACRLSGEVDSVAGLDIAGELLDHRRRSFQRLGEWRAGALAERPFEAASRGSDLVESRRRGDLRWRVKDVLERKRGLLGLLDPGQFLREPERHEPRA